MSEQQRVFAALALSLGIFLIWQYFFTSPPRPQAAQAPVATEQVANEKNPAPAADADSKGAPRAEPAKVAPVAEAAPDAPVMAAAPAVEDRELAFETPLYAGTLSSGAGALVRFSLKHYDERANGDGKGKREPVSLVAKGEKDARPEQAVVDLELGGSEVRGFQAQKDGDAFVLTTTSPSGIAAKVRIQPRQDAYALDYDVTLENGGTETLPTDTRMLLRLPLPKDGKHSMFSPMAEIVGALCDVGGSLERKHAKDLKEGPWTSPQAARWGGLDRQYFVVAAVASDAKPLGCEARADEGLMMVALQLGHESLAPGGKLERKLTLFAGPKRQQDLEKVSPLLGDAIDYNLWGIPLGFLSRPMVFLLNVFHGLTASWGLAILLLTVFVKLLLFPVTYKSAVSMRRMQLIKPEMDKLKVRFEGDRERQQVELMKLYKEKGVNPFGGCLPMLLQMPVWFALYRTLWTAVDLYQQSFLWIPDLTAKEPLPFLALALGVLTYIQQKLTPTPDSQQAKIMLYVMPVMLTVFMINLPSGLVLYILVNSVLTIAQQLVINRRQVAL